MHHQTLHWFLTEAGLQEFMVPSQARHQAAGQGWVQRVTSQFPQSQTGHIRAERRQRVETGELVHTPCQGLIHTSPNFGHTAVEVEVFPCAVWGCDEECWAAAGQWHRDITQFLV